MNQVPFPLLIALTVAVASGAIAPPRAVAADREQEFATRINEANAALRNEDFDAAISGYDSAAEIDSDRDELLYNKAVALYRKGDVAAAEQLFSSVATSLDPQVAAKARFNAGNCHYAAAVQSRDEDRSAAIESLRGAIEQYRSALAIEPTDTDARTNIELAARLLRQLQQEEQREQQQQQQQQQEQQEQQQQDQQEQDQKQQDQDQQQQDQQQQDQQEQSSGSQNQPNQPGEQGEQEDSSSDEPASSEHGSPEPQQPEQTEQQQTEQQQPESGGEESDAQSDRDDNAADAKPGEPQQQDEASGAQQRSAAENPSSSRPDLNRDELAEPPSDPSAAAEEESGDEAEETLRGQLTAASESDEAPQTDQSVAMGGGDREGELTEQEAYKMLQVIRDRDMLRRLQRESAERSRRTPVDRDW